MSSDRPRDSLYVTRHEPIGAFTFDEVVADVFADMIRRSVPGYSLILAMIGLLVERYAQAGSQCYDLGCSLGAATLAMRRHIQQPGCRIVAVDNSGPMVERCRQNIAADGTGTPVEVICADIRDVAIERASVVVLNFTLQFIAPPDRLAVLKQIYKGLLPDGVLILSEKITFTAPELQTLFTEMHETFKRANGYSDLEISQKRTALENVLIPDTLEQHQKRLHEAGFQTSQLWFQCFNFASLLAWN